MVEDFHSASDTFLGCDILKDFIDGGTENPDGWPIDTNMPGPEEIGHIYDLLKGYTEQFFPKIPYRKLLTTVQEIDDVHGEIAERQKRWSDVIYPRCFVVPSAVTQPLSGFGIEDDRTAEVYIAVPDLIEAGLGTQDDEYDITLIGRIGDHFMYHKVEYVINTFVPAAWFANTDIVLYYQLKATRFRTESVDSFGNY